jgi:uncharacterized iron-regulated protein
VPRPAASEAAVPRRAYRRAALLAAALCAAGGCASGAPVGPPWRSPLATDHPLVGVLLDMSTGERVAPEAMVERVAPARFVLLGEKHDNPDHHRLQAWVVERLAAGGRRPALVWEMLDSSQREALARHLRERPRDAAGLGEAVAFEENWGSWELYRPIADAALAAELPLVAGNLAPAELRRASAAPGPERDDALRRALDLDRPYPEASRALLARQIDEGHCGQVPATAIPAMLEAQRARDAALARALMLAGPEGAILIAGTGHTRADLGVPWALRARDPDATVASVAFVEVEHDALTPAEALRAASAVGPHDFVWLTPRVDDLDPCARLQEQLEGMRKLGQAGTWRETSKRSKAHATSFVSGAHAAQRSAAATTPATSAPPPAWRATRPAANATATTSRLKSPIFTAMITMFRPMKPMSPGSSGTLR